MIANRATVAATEWLTADLVAITYRHPGHHPGGQRLIRAVNYAGAAPDMLPSSHASAGAEASPDFRP